MRTAYLGLLFHVACSKGDGASKSPKLVIKPVPVHQPTPDELGPPVDAKTAWQALCESVPDDGVTRTSDEMQRYVMGALIQYPNADVTRTWEGMGERSKADRMTTFRAQLDASGITSCHLYDLMSKPAP
jgi:hypothetical protein